MADDLPTWMIAIIAVSAAVLFVFLFCCLWRYCCRRNHDKTFRWIERLGIPFAREGQPTDQEMTKDMKLRVHVTTGNNGTVDRSNTAYEQDENDVGSLPPPGTRVRVGTELEEPEPFKRLDQLGIPRAQRGNTPLGGRRVPNAPLPSPTPADIDESSSDEEISIHQ